MTGANNEDGGASPSSKHSVASRRNVDLDWGIATIENRSNRRNGRTGWSSKRDQQAAEHAVQKGHNHSCREKERERDGEGEGAEGLEEPEKRLRNNNGPDMVLWFRGSIRRKRTRDRGK